MKSYLHFAAGKFLHTSSTQQFAHYVIFSLLEVITFHCSQIAGSVYISLRKGTPTKIGTILTDDRLSYVDGHLSEVVQPTIID